MSKLRSSAYLVGANLVAAAIQFVAIRMYLRWFGDDGYSGILYIYAIWGYVTLICPDFSFGAQKRLVEGLARSDRDGVRAIHQSQLFGALVTAVCAMVLALVLGLVFRLPGSSSPAMPILAMILVAAAGFGLRIVSATITALLAAKERFDLIAIRQAVESLVGAIAAVGLAYVTRSPVALLVGGAVGAGAGLAANVLMLRNDLAGFRLVPKLHRRVLGDLWHLHLKALPHTVVNQFASGLDRVLLPFAGGRIGVVSSYAVPYRLPETLAGLLGPAIDTTVPELTRQSASSPEGFARAIDRYGLQALAVGAALILVPSGWGAPFLEIWLGDKAPVGGALVVLLIGFYFCLNFYYGTLTRAFRATGEMQRVVAFSGFNALATLVLTIPAARWAGIVGVAAMNAAINAVQLVPFVLTIRRHATPELHALRHVTRAAAILSLGSALAWVGYLASQCQVVARLPWLCLVLAPATCVVALACIVGLRLAPLPERLQRLGPKRG